MECERGGIRRVASFSTRPFASSKRAPAGSFVLKVGPLPEEKRSVEVTFTTNGYRREGLVSKFTVGITLPENMRIACRGKGRWFDIKLMDCDAITYNYDFCIEDEMAFLSENVMARHRGMPIPPDFMEQLGVKVLDAVVEHIHAEAPAQPAPGASGNPALRVRLVLHSILHFLGLEGRITLRELGTEIAHTHRDTSGKIVSFRKRLYSALWKVHRDWFTFFDKFCFTNGGIFSRLSDNCDLSVHVGSIVTGYFNLVTDSLMRRGMDEISLNIEYLNREIDRFAFYLLHLC